MSHLHQGVRDSVIEVESKMPGFHPSSSALPDGSGGRVVVTEPFLRSCAGGRGGLGFSLSGVEVGSYTNRR